MFVEVVRSGGIAGITRRGRVDTEAVADAHTAHEWNSLIEAALPLVDDLRHASASSVPDGFTWTVSIGGTSCVADDASVTGPLRDLALRALREGRTS